MRGMKSLCSGAGLIVAGFGDFRRINSCSGGDRKSKIFLQAETQVQIDFNIDNSMSNVQI